MNIDFNQRIEQEVGNSIKTAVSALLEGYNSPLSPLINQAVKNNAAAITTLLQDSIQSCLTNPDFTRVVRDECDRRLAKALVAKFDGAIEQELNKMKSDPVTRAKVTIAIAEMMEKVRK